MNYLQNPKICRQKTSGVWSEKRFALLAPGGEDNRSAEASAFGPQGFCGRKFPDGNFLPQKMLRVGLAVAARSRDASRRSRAMTHIVSAGGNFIRFPLSPSLHHSIVSHYKQPLIFRSRQMSGRSGSPRNSAYPVRRAPHGRFFIFCTRHLHQPCGDFRRHARTYVVSILQISILCDFSFYFRADNFIYSR